MDDQGGYQIEVMGRMDVHGLNDAGPLQVRRLGGDEHSTIFEVWTDQSGLIGLLRHLHGRGAFLLSVHRWEQTPPNPPPINDEDSS